MELLKGRTLKQYIVTLDESVPDLNACSLRNRVASVRPVRPQPLRGSPSPAIFVPGGMGGHLRLSNDSS